MHTIETSIVLTVVMVSLTFFMNFCFKYERRVYKDINLTNEEIKKEYTIEGKKKFVPEKIQRIIKNIELLKED